MFTTPIQSTSLAESQALDRVPFVRRFLADTFFLLTGFPFALLAFLVGVTGLCAAVGLIPVALLGLPLAYGVAHVLRWLADVQRQRLARIGPELSSPEYRPATQTGMRRYMAPFQDPQWRRDMSHSVLAFPIAVLTWTLTVTLWALAIGFALGVPIGAAITPLRESMILDLGFYQTTDPLIVCGLSVTIGLAFMAVLPFLIRGLARLQAGASIAILGHYSVRDENR